MSFDPIQKYEDIKEEMLAKKEAFSDKVNSNLDSAGEFLDKAGELSTAFLRGAAKVAVLSAAVGVTVGSGIEYLQYIYPHESGSKDGLVYDLHTKDVVVETEIGKFSVPFCTTYEGVMSTSGFGGLNGKAGSLVNTFTFSVEDPRVIKIIQDAKTTGTSLELNYKITHEHLACFRKTDTLVTGATPKEAAPAAIGAPVPAQGVEFPAPGL